MGFSGWEPSLLAVWGDLAPGAPSVPWMEQDTQIQQVLLGTGSQEHSPVP